MPHSQDILINWSPQETRVAIIESGAVQELHVERTLERGLVGNVYTGKVVRVLPGMQSAFIDIGLERTAFKHLGAFPEQASNWEWIVDQVAVTGPDTKVLNLFAYTGGASLAARRRIDQDKLDVWLQVDGGIDETNIQRVAELGADTFVAGSAVFKSQDRAKQIQNLRDLAEIGISHRH